MNEPACYCEALGQPVYEETGVHHLVDCLWVDWFMGWGAFRGRA